MLPRRAGTEVSASDDDLGVLVTSLVQDEVGVRSPVVVVSPVEEQEFTESGALHPLEKLLGDDLVRIDIDAVHGQNHAGQLAEGFHEVVSSVARALPELFPLEKRTAY